MNSMATNLFPLIFEWDGVGTPSNTAVPVLTGHVPTVPTNSIGYLYESVYVNGIVNRVYTRALYRKKVSKKWDSGNKNSLVTDTTAFEGVPTKLKTVGQFPLQWEQISVVYQPISTGATPC